METITTPHPDYMKGFNEGYLLRESFPDLANKLSDALHGSERAEGFKHGKEQFDLDKDLDKGVPDKNNSYTPSWLNPDRFNDNLDKETNREDHDLEPDMD